MQHADSTRHICKPAPGFVGHGIGTELAIASPGAHSITKEATYSEESAPRSSGTIDHSKPVCASGALASLILIGLSSRAHKGRALPNPARPSPVALANASPTV